jgi:hypothetical protein
MASQAPCSCSCMRRCTPAVVLLPLSMGPGEGEIKLWSELWRGHTRWEKDAQR